MILFQTLIGSRLHGLHTEESDYDIMTVIADNPTVKGLWVQKDQSDPQQDRTLCDLNTFLTYCDRGSPQFLEALWSPIADVDMITDLRANFHPSYASTVTTYNKIIKRTHFSTTVKGKRNCYRMHLNLYDYVYFGKFNPTLDQEHKDRLHALMLKDPPHEELTYG